MGEDTQITNRLSVTKRIIGVTTIVAFAGCATKAADIPPASVSPLQYAAYDCAQLSAEALRLEGHMRALGATLDDAAANDVGRVVTGVLFFLPAFFFLGGTKEQEAEFGRLLGERFEVQQTAIRKNCPGYSLPGPAGCVASGGMISCTPAHQ